MIFTHGDKGSYNIAGGVNW